MPELFEKRYYDCLFNLSVNVENTRHVVQCTLADLSERWRTKLAEKFTAPSEVTNCQFAMKELEFCLKNKRPSDILQILGELFTCELPTSIENAFWFLENYVLTHVPRTALQKFYPLFSKIVGAYSDSGHPSCVKIWLLIISDDAWDYLPQTMCSCLNWIHKGFIGIPDSLRTIAFLMHNDNGRKCISHFPHTKEHLSECSKEQKKLLFDAYKDTVPKRSYFPGLLRLIKLCRKQREKSVDEIKQFYSDRSALKSESSIYYIGALQTLIAVFYNLHEKDQDEQIRLMCGLCQSAIFKNFTNTQTISWLLDCACKKKNKYGDKAAKALSMLVNECNPSEAIFDTAMDKLVGLFSSLDKSSMAYKALASSYISILEPRIWHIVNNGDVINDMAEWLELDAISDAALSKYLDIVTELARWEDGQKVLARPKYIRALCKILGKQFDKGKSDNKYKLKVYVICKNISRYREFESTDAIHTLREELCKYIGSDTNELQHKEVVEALANTMTNAEASEDAWNKGFISAILSFHAMGEEQLLDIIKLLNRSISSKKVCDLVIQSHGDLVIKMYNHEHMKSLVINAIESISQNLSYLFYNPKFLVKLLRQVPLFKEWNDFLENGMLEKEQFEKREFIISKMNKSLIYLAGDPDCHLLIIEIFVQKHLDLINKSSDNHIQYELLQFVNDLLLINPILFSHPQIASYLNQIKALGNADKGKIASLTLWCFSLFFDINYSKEYAKFYEEAGILAYITEIMLHPDLQVFF